MHGRIQQLEHDQDDLRQAQQQLVMENQQLKGENSQLLSDHEELKGQLEARASQSQTQALQDMQTFVQQTCALVSQWQQRLAGYSSDAGDPAMSSFLLDQSTAQDLWTDQDNEFGLPPTMSLDI